jgi:hypothetical protein
LAFLSKPKSLKVKFFKTTLPFPILLSARAILGAFDGVHLLGDEVINTTHTSA